MDAERRLLFRQGALLLLVSALLGIVVAAQAPHPQKWMAAHVAGMMTGLLIIGFGALWPEVRLDTGPRRWAVRLGLVAAWLGVVANVFSAIVNLPGPATDPGGQPAAPWHLPVLLAMLAIIVPSTLISFFLVWRGLRD